MADDIGWTVIGVLVFVIWVYIMVFSTAWMWGDKVFYRIEQPVPIIDRDPKWAVLEFTHYSLNRMRGEYSFKISCETGVVNLEPKVCSIEPGHKVSQHRLPIPPHSGGQCHFEGIVTYHPFWQLEFAGPINCNLGSGRVVSCVDHYWESMPFSITS